MPETTPEAPKQHPSRRSVIKVGAHAAWAIPAIQIAAATPAFAASTDHARLSLGGSTARPFSRNGINGTGKLVVKNVGNASAEATTVTLSGSGVDYTSGITVTDESGKAWTVTKGATTAAVNIGQLTAGASKTLTFSFKVTQNGKGAQNPVSAVATCDKAKTDGTAYPSDPVSATI